MEGVFKAGCTNVDLGFITLIGAVKRILHHSGYRILRPRMWAGWAVVGADIGWVKAEALAVQQAEALHGIDTQGLRWVRPPPVQLSGELNVARVVDLGFLAVLGAK